MSDASVSVGNLRRLFGPGILSAIRGKGPDPVNQRTGSSPQEERGVSGSIDEDNSGSVAASSKPLPSFVDHVLGSGEAAVQNPVVRTVATGTSPAVPLAPSSDASSPPSPKTSPSVRKKAVRPPVGDLSVGLANISKEAKALPGGQYDVGPLIHVLSRSDKELLRRIYEQLAHPYVDLGDKKVETVIGLGAHGGFLAEGVATCLPSIGDCPVDYLPMERYPERGWHFASDEMVAEELRAKSVLLIAPALTPSTLGDVEACLQLLRLSKEAGGIGGNVNVLGVATPFVFNCKPEIKNGCKSFVVTWLHSVQGLMDLPSKK